MFKGSSSTTRMRRWLTGLGCFVRCLVFIGAHHPNITKEFMIGFHFAEVNNERRVFENPSCLVQYLMKFFLAWAGAQQRRLPLAVASARQTVFRAVPAVL
ncbi:MAG TPA: hypothetical protein VND95_02895 [Stellaceae bacterium]|nr:hypothetical protein [Stellaceae bacterium]